MTLTHGYSSGGSRDNGPSCGPSSSWGATASVREPKAVEEWLEERVEFVVRFGGTAGAYRLEPHYRGSVTVAHLGPPSEETRRRLKAIPASDGDLVWMRHIGEASKNGETSDTVHPLLVYSELVSDPDPRAVEAADLIRERRLPWSL